MPVSTRRLIIALSLLTAVILVASGCGSDESSESEESTSAAPTTPQRMDVQSLWIRPAPAGGNSALYMRLVNGTAAPDTLVRVSVSEADTVEIHESYQRDDGMTGMRPIGPLPVAPKSNVVLEPGGKHVMLLNLKEPLVSDSTVAVRLTFSRAGMRRVQAPIQNTAPSGN